MDNETTDQLNSLPLKDPLHQFAQQLSNMKTLRDGRIVLRMTGESGGNYCLHCKGGRVTLSQDIPEGSHNAELIGEAKQIRPILDGKKDARAHFLAGGFRVKGDIKYISDLAMELGLLKQPI